MSKKSAGKETLQDLSVSELEARLKEVQEKSFRLKFQHASNPVKNPMEIRETRRSIARIMTVLRQKEKVS
jgi:large subunit ribosomal protein L29